MTKKLLKNKVGSAVVEMLIVLPILIYVIIFATTKVVGLVAYSEVYKNGIKLVNNVVLEKDAISALNKMSIMITTENMKESITNIKITKNYNDPLLEPISVEIDFPVDFEGSRNSFKAYSSTDGFNWTVFKANNRENAEEFEKFWEKDATIEITLERDLIKDAFGNLLDYRYYDPVEQKWKQAPFIVDTNLIMKSSGILEN